MTEKHLKKCPAALVISTTLRTKKTRPWSCGKGIHFLLHRNLRQEDHKFKICLVQSLPGQFSETVSKH